MRISFGALVSFWIIIGVIQTGVIYNMERMCKNEPSSYGSYIVGTIIWPVIAIFFISINVENITKNCKAIKS